MSKKGKDELDEKLKNSHSPEQNENANEKAEEEKKKKKKASVSDPSQKVTAPVKRQTNSTQKEAEKKPKTMSKPKQEQSKTAKSSGDSQDPNKQQTKKGQPTGAARMRSAPNIRYNIPNSAGGRTATDNEITTRQTTTPKGTVRVRQSGADLVQRSSNGQGATSGAPRTNRSYYTADSAPPKPIEKPKFRERPQGYQPVKPLIKRGKIQKPIVDEVSGMVIGYEVENIIFDPLTGDSRTVKQTTKFDKPISQAEAQETLNTGVSKEAAQNANQQASGESGKAQNAQQSTPSSAETPADATSDNWAETHDFEIRHEAKDNADVQVDNLGPMNADSPDASPSVEIDLSADEGGEEIDAGFDGGENASGKQAGGENTNIDGDFEDVDGEFVPEQELFQPDDPENYEEFDPELEEFEEIEGDSETLEGEEYEGEEYEGEEYEGEEYENQENAEVPPFPPSPPDVDIEGEEGYGPPPPPPDIDYDEDYYGDEYEGEAPELEEEGEPLPEKKKKKEKKLDNRTQEEKEEARKKWRKLLIILLLLLVVTGFTIFGIFIAPELFEVPVVYYINPTTDQETFIISKELEGVKFMPGHTIMFEEVLKIKNEAINEEGIKNNMFAFSVNAYIEFNGRRQPENIIDRIVFASDAAFIRYKDNRALYFYRDVVAPTEEVEVVKGIVLSGPNLKNSEIVGQEVNLVFEVEACYPAEELLYDFSYYDNKMISWIYQIVDIADELKSQGYQ